MYVCMCVCMYVSKVNVWLHTFPSVFSSPTKLERRPLDKAYRTVKWCKELVTKREASRMKKKGCLAAY